MPARDPAVEDRPQPDAPDDAEAPVDVSIVLAAYNEAANVRTEVDRITAAMEATAYRFEILLVDDGSTDGTGELVEGLPHVRVMHFPANRGSGTARRIGTTEARGQWVVWTDVDMTYPNERIPELIDILAEGEVHQVVGARTSEQGSLKPLRVPAKWAIRRLAEWLVRTPIPDLNSGLRAFSKDHARPFLGMLPSGFSCVTTLTLAFLSSGLVLSYLPIDYAPRSGRSHFHPIKDAYRYILQVLRMVTFFEPLRVFTPVALVLLIVGTGKFTYDMITNPFALAINTILLILTGLILFSLGLLADLIVSVNRRS